MNYLEKKKLYEVSKQIYREDMPNFVECHYHSCGGSERLTFSIRKTEIYSLITVYAAEEQCFLYIKEDIFNWDTIEQVDVKRVCMDSFKELLVSEEPDVFLNYYRKQVSA